MKNVRDQQEEERSKWKEKGKNKKKREDNQTCTLIFCENSSCIDVFESREAYEEHLLSEKHTFTHHDSSMDQVKASYVERIKSSSNLRSSLAPTTASRSVIDFNEAVKETPLLLEISKQGWALPQRQFFRFEYETKLELYNIFMDGERTNQKKTSEQAANIIRSKKLQYVTPAQIKSLFSTFSRQKRDGTLTAPVKPKTTETQRQENVTIDEDEVEYEDERIGEEDETDESVHISDLRDEVDEILHNLNDWKINDFVAVRWQQAWYPGKILEMNETYLVSLMEYVDNPRFTNKFRWPEETAVNEFDYRDILLKLDEPIAVSRGRRQGYFTFTDDDYMDASDILTMSLKE